MATTARLSAYAVCAIVCGAIAVPASGWASSGGSGLTPGGSAVTSSTGASSGPGINQASVVHSGNVSVSTSGHGVTLFTNASAMLRQGLSFSGTAPRRLAGDSIEIDRSGHQTNWSWAPTVTATVRSNGSFTAVWHTNHIGRFAVRAVVVRPAMAQTAMATPALTITVYRPSVATQYGPGFYGNRTACGEQLTKTMIGVANRTLKCGTNVAVYYRGRTLIVPVIDRGPYANGVDWDLTEATGRALGIDGTTQIGAVSLPTR